MKFTKYHGLGNDFLLVVKEDSTPHLTEELIRATCHRQTGVGADGLILVEHDSTPRMRVYNADGSQPEMCGNGIRCFVKFCVDRLGYTDNPLLVQTEAGLKSCSWETNESAVSSVTVEMGPALFGPADIPLPASVTTNHLSLTIEGESLELDCVSMGNPHAVLFGTWTQDDILRLGPLIQANPCFPQGVNVGFAHYNEDHTLSLAVYERGAGLTQACGTGACAAASAAISRGFFGFDEDVRVSLPGGDLLIRVAEQYAQTWMSGPATLVMDGKSHLE